jgi:hypothetical protein
MTLATLLAIAFSGVLLILLGARDPKRLRNARHATKEAASDSPLPSAVRRLFGWLSLAPGVALGIAGEWWAFLIWLGAITAIGWAIAITAGYSTFAVSHRSRS